MKIILKNRTLKRSSTEVLGYGRYVGRGKSIRKSIEEEENWKWWLLINYQEVTK